MVTETLLCLKHQLLGALSGLGQFAHGTLIRPLGFRAADLLMQEYEGTVTIYPRWSLWELFSFLSNFNQARAREPCTGGRKELHASPTRSRMSLRPSHMSALCLITLAQALPEPLPASPLRPPPASPTSSAHARCPHSPLLPDKHLAAGRRPWLTLPRPPPLTLCAAQARVAQYILDGERAAWPHLEVVHSLTEIEYTLDAVAAELQCAIRGKLPRPDSKAEYGSLSRPSSRAASNADIAGSPGAFGDGTTATMLGGPSRGRLPSYVSLDAYGGMTSSKQPPLSPALANNGKPPKPPTPPWAREPAGGTALGVGGSITRKNSAIPGVASHASLFNMGLEAEDEPPASVGLVPF